MSTSTLDHPDPQTVGGLRVRGKYVTGMALVVALMMGIIAVFIATPATAASRVEVSPVPSADGPTTVTLSGSGFQYQPNAPGGVYIFFGTVNDPMTNSWAPSQGGSSGGSYAYSATSGTQLLAAFEGGSSAGSAAGTIDANGNWNAQMTIPGSTFTATFGDPHSGQDQSGQTINCLEVQCGIITIGAHGLINANNESFTPISFQTSSGQQSGTGTVNSFTEPESSNETQSNNQESGAQSEAEIDDDAVVLDVPGDDSDDEVTQDATPEVLDEALTAENTDVLQEDEGSSVVTWIILGVLAFAVLVLIIALTLVLAKRSRAKKAAAIRETTDA